MGLMFGQITQRIKQMKLQALLKLKEIIKIMKEEEDKEQQIIITDRLELMCNVTIAKKWDI
jgi:hypothetical protein